MIVGVGIDCVEIERCAIWTFQDPGNLERIFSKQEISYCQEHAHKTAERFAARFAAREAFYKALCAAYPDVRIPFLTLCRLVEVVQIPDNAPTLSINWPTMGDLQPLRCHTSLTHTRTTATALVILEACKAATPVKSSPSTRTFV